MQSAKRLIIRCLFLWSHHASHMIASMHRRIITYHRACSTWYLVFSGLKGTVQVVSIQNHAIMLFVFL